MRLARLAAVGLAIGVIAGFAAALLRPRPEQRTDWGPEGADPQLRRKPAPSDSLLWARFDRANRAGKSRAPGIDQSSVDRDVDQSAVVDLHTRRRVTG